MVTNDKVKVGKANFMADIQILGFIRQVKYLQDGVLVFIDEFKSGYKRSDGTSVGDKVLSWRCIFANYFKKFVSQHFGNGMLVQVKGEVLPYAIEHGNVVDGYSVMGQTLNRASYPKSGSRAEVQAIKESAVVLDGAGDVPDVKGFNESDF